MHILENVTQQRYAKFIEQNLWTQIATSPAYSWLDRKTGSAKGYCCFFSNPHDWLRFAQLLITKGQSSRCASGEFFMD